MRWTAPIPLLLAACAGEPTIGQAPPASAPAAEPDAAADFTATERSDGAVVFDIRHSAPDATRLWIEDVADCRAADYAVANGHASATRIGQREITVEAGVGFPQPLMTGSFVYRFHGEGVGSAGGVNAVPVLERCRAEGLI